MKEISTIVRFPNTGIKIFEGGGVYAAPITFTDSTYKRTVVSYYSDKGWNEKDVVIQLLNHLADNKEDDYLEKAYKELNIQDDIR